MISLNVNGVTHELDDADAHTPLLWVLRDRLGMTGTKYGCGISMCGACTVHLDGRPVLACQYVISDLDAREITTIEGLAPERAYALYEAWAAEKLPPCDRCQSGQIMRAAALLAQHARPSRTQIDEFMKINNCHCGSETRMAGVIERAAAALVASTE